MIFRLVLRMAKVGDATLLVKEQREKFLVLLFSRKRKGQTKHHQQCDKNMSCFDSIIFFCLSLTFKKRKKVAIGTEARAIYHLCI